MELETLTTSHREALSLMNRPFQTLQGIAPGYLPLPQPYQRWSQLGTAASGITAGLDPLPEFLLDGTQLTTPTTQQIATEPSFLG